MTHIVAMVMITMTAYKKFYRIDTCPNMLLMKPLNMLKMWPMVLFDRLPW
jgi:hypothetical protein